MISVTPGPGEELLLHPSPDYSPKSLSLMGARRAGARYLFPARLADLEALRDSGLPLSVADDLYARLKRRAALDEHLSSATDLRREATHPSWKRLDGHQRVGVGFLASRPRALLAFSPGLGKSATAIIAAEVMNHLPALVVAPLTLLPTWRYEIGAWGRGLPVANLRDDEPVDGWNLINPDQLKKRLKELRAGRYKLVIFDESVLYKSRSASRTKAAASLAESIPNAWMLSGSPITHFADDLWAQLNILRPKWFRSYWRFARQWTHISKTPWGDKIVGNLNPSGLRENLRDIMLSRTPAEVPVLPDAPLEVVRVQLTKKQTKALEDARDKFEVNGLAITGVLAQLTRMAQVVSYPRILGIEDDGAKLAAVKELRDWAPAPLIVWCWFRDTAERVAHELKADVIHGGTSPKAREEVLDRFQRGETEVLVLQQQTGKFGLSLTTAKSVVFFDRSFGLDDWVQATARVRRRSSTAPVPTYVLDGGWTDNLVSLALRRKLRSVTDLGVSDLLAQLK